MTHQSEILRRFVTSFSFENELPLNGDKLLENCRADPVVLNSIYENLPAPFPPMYEDLILSYRWPLDADIRLCRLFANPPGPDLSGLLKQILSDKVLSAVCLGNGFIPFGKGPNMSYDPICFDTNKSRGRNYKIVRVKHEPILKSEKIGKPIMLWESFEELVQKTLSTL